MKKTYKYLLFFILLVIFFLPEYYLPVLEKHFGWQTPELGGEIGRKNKPIFFPRKCLTGAYQKQYAQYLKSQNPIRSLLVRARNQVEFSVLNTIGNTLVLPGKDGMLFSKGYADAFIGLDFRGQDWIVEKVKKLRTIIDYFEKKEIHFLVLTPPGKPRIYPKKLPAAYRNHQTKRTNRAVFRAMFKAYDIPVIDFEFFLDYEEKVGLPVYPQTGLHWNYLGAAIVADTMQRYFSSHKGLVFPDFIWPDTIAVHSDFEMTDTELLRSINLSDGLKVRPSPYPAIQFGEMPDSLCPKAVVIGDSYYKILLKKGYHKALFQKGSPFWYYFKTEVFDTRQQPKFLQKKEQKIMKKLNNANVIILSYSEGNLAKFGFIDFLYEVIKTENK